MKSKLPEGWKEVELVDVVKIISGGTPKRKEASYWNGDIPWISVKDFPNDGKYIETTDEKITKKGLDNSSTNILSSNDIIISARGTVGKLGIIKYPMAFNQSCYGLRSNELVMNNNFFYYFLKYDIERLKKRGHGSVFNTIIRSTLEKLNIKLPPLTEQKAIANTLSSLDDKIERNNKINENLEQQAQAIFKHWFVDFEFPNEEGKPYKSSGGEMIDSELGMIPKGWEVKDLLEIFDVIGGSQPPKKEHIYEEREGYVRFIQNRDYAGNEAHLTYIKESKRNKICDKFDILIDKYGEAGKTRFGIEGAYNVALAKIEPKAIEDREIIRRFLEQSNIEQYLYNASIASTRPSLNRTTFTGMKIAMPDFKIKETFNDLSLNFINIILQNKQQNQTLSQLRDTLLPKLMSGEIRIPLD